ncbi:RHS repeat-associated core domain-containing protein [Flavobacterium branchiophilum]|uniref:RHS repeat-associated protein n=1 Tax=Flavobacterium branchiophilum TaxID=55197 RepID=A0A543G2F6_9FLAO|nr:RHS repeat-associated core domain-containing protein [Flavobacterium branchiophilum]TQM40239.1 RHS repeat-associated protein [Flavobacterium branchiophilum]GEM53936.1 type IV secretion protein Rhs [Flavobacterium branchiophilum NBRC 15030 = ATCC 35035]
MLLTDNHLTCVVGIDIHFTTLPPYNPFHPYIGIVIDPADYIPFIGTDVHVNGFKRGNSDTGGIIIPLVHIPLFTPPWLMTPIIGHESMNFFASEKTYSDGTRLSPKGYMLMTCNDIGIPLSLSIGKTKIGKKMLPFAPTLFAPTSFSLPIPTGKPVMVGGPYVPDWAGMLTGLLASIGFSTLMKFGKKLFNKLLKGGIGPNWLSKLLCKCGFEPVNLVNGAVIYEGSDFDFTSPIPLNWERRWYSDSEYIGWLGHGVHCAYDRAVELFPEDDALGLRMDDGRIVAFPTLQPNEEFYLRQEKTTLKRTSKGYEAYDHTAQLFYVFEQFDGNKYQLSQIKNHYNLAITFTFANNRIVKIIDTAGREILVTNNRQGQIEQLQLVAPKGLETLVSYQYDDNQNLIAIADALGNPTVMQFENHLMVKKTDRNGQAFYWEYDKQNRCIHTWGDDGWQEGWIEYFPNEGYNLVKDANGAVTTYYYTPDQLITQIKDPMGNSEFFDYTDYMELYRKIDQEGRITGFTYDNFGNKVSVTYPDNTQEIFAYNEHNKLVIAVDPEGQKTVYLYDKEKPNQLKTIIDPDKSTTFFSYTDNGQIATVAKNNNQLQLVYDQQHNLMEWHENNQKIRNWRYNHRGRVIAEEFVNQTGNYFEYDLLDRLEKISQNDGNKIQLAYNNYDEVIALKDEKNNIKFEYTPMGSLAVREQNGVKVRFAYDKMEQLKMIRNEHGEAYSFSRNRAGHIIKETAFDGIEKRYKRNLAGEVYKIERPGNKWTEYEQDALGRITRANHHDGSWELYSYNKNGLLVEATNQNVSIYLERDANGRVVKETQKQHLDSPENAITITNTYNQLGQRTSIETSLGGKITTQYDHLGNLQQLEAQSAELLEKQQSWQTTIKRDDAGREIERFVTGGLRTETRYTSSGKIDRQDIFSNNRRTGYRSYHWTTNNQLSSVATHITQDPTVFNYDEFGSLALEIVKFDVFYKTPDAVGNLYKSRDQDDRKYGKGGKLIKDDKYFYHYDEEGNLILKSTRDITKPLEVPKATNFIDRLFGHTEEQKDEIANHQNWQQGDTAYTWLANGMLASVTKEEGTTVKFEYDALGRRTAKLIIPPLGARGLIYRYFWDGNVLLHEWHYNLKERPKLVIQNGDLVYTHPEPTPPLGAGGLVTWVYEEGSFAPCAKIVGEEKYSIINDYIGRPIQCYNESGNIVWETDYDIYGNLRNLQGERSFIPFRQLGQYEDVETGLYYNRFRYYSPETGAYISQDPIGLAGNNPNFYAYVSDSNSWVDVFGLDTSSDAAILRSNMIRDGVDVPNYGNSAHHIVMSNSTDANMIALRTKMTNMGIDINNSSNGIFLPSSSKVKNDFNLDAHAHSRVHTKEYKKNVFERLKDITDVDKFKNELEKIGKELSEGTFKIKCK